MVDMGGLAAAGRVGEGEESKSKQVTMFLGPCWECVLYVRWRGGAKGTTVYVLQGSNEGQQGERGGMV